MYTCWIGLVTISLGISLAAFIWAWRNGQLSDQGRARYLPLSDELPLQPIRHSSKLGLQAYVLLFIVILGSMGIIGSVVLSLWRFGR